MRDSIFYSAARALAVAFCVVIGLSLGFAFLTIMIGAMSGGVSSDGNLSTVNTEEILPDASGVRKKLSSDSPVILQVNINGVIGMENLDSKSIRQQLVESREEGLKNDRVKALLLYINTPGGTVSDADGIFRALMAYKKKYSTPIYAYVDGLCASGGIYVALAADKVFASDTSLIGSVGVIAPTFMNLTKLLDKVGVETLTISEGKGKDAMNPLRPWKEGEDANYRQIIEYYYDHFVDLVTTHRPAITKELLVKEYGARIFPAPLAQEYGFIDVSAASLGETIEALAQAADLPPDTYQVIRLENKNWWNSLFSSKASALFSGKMKHQLSLSPELDLMVSNQFLYLYCPQ